MTRFFISAHAQRSPFLLSRSREEAPQKKWVLGKSRILILALILLSGLIYLIQINQVATGGFEVRALEEKIGDLKEDNKKLELQITELQSLSRLNEEVKDLDLVAQGEVDYLIPKEEAYALGESR